MPAGYAERLVPPWWLWLLGAAFVASVALAFFVPFGPVVAVPAALLTAAGVGLGLWATVARIEVRDGQLRAGRAHIPVTLLGEPTVLTGAAARQARGPGFNPSGYHLLRAWVPTAVLVEVHDPQDPTPHWYVSTRRPEQLAAAITAARGSPPS